ncbi:bifunctional 4-hydroxy-2-oxoglutarate aldolase/2-dehydro-3-deoxy-phosphogluconate aldolase [Microbacterium sp. NPDC076895]|uniref:bifunctional 4-hydroxy-2-oxoglutarate aldolase/2-dehydro-3-deoxy-phosphogluconate aldolase n=1 Tax=Microbacterium sp. NPDC076895 TaxID=3154957 RepID=UPI00341C6738
MNSLAVTHGPVRVPISKALQETRIIAILRATDASRAEAVVHTLIENGVRCLELTMTTAGALDVIRRLASQLPDDIDLGMGTVLNADHVDLASNAGARFVVSPDVSTEVIKAANSVGLASYPGALTPTEIVTAWNAGASAVKLFPGGALGIEYLRALRAPLPDIPLIPTGAVDVENVDAWLRAGASAVGLGGSLIGDAMTPNGDLTALARRTRSVCAAVSELTT